MFDIKWIRENPEAFDRALAGRRNVPFKAAELIALDEQRRSVIVRLNEAQEKRNANSKLIGQAKAQKDEAKAQALMVEVAILKDVIQQGEAEQRELDQKLRDALAVIPNLPANGVPVGEDESANVEYFGRNLSAEIAAKDRAPKPVFTFKPKEHFETGEALGQMDFEIAAKLSGSRFVVLKSHLARMERALGQFMLDLHVDQHGYTEVQPPLLVKDDALFGTNQLPKFEEDLFRTTRFTEKQIEAVVYRYTQEALGDARKQYEADTLELFANSQWIVGKGPDEIMATMRESIDFSRMTNTFFAEKRVEAKRSDLLDENRLYLIPTAEVPLTNLVRESIVAEEELPLRFTALTPCFRSEAGSAGRDTRGMIRQHQFNKVEMVAITTPEASADEHEKMLGDAEDVLKKLGLHYRVMQLSTGDMGFGAQRTYDLEVWLPGQDTYREISSVSVCGDFQARRMEAQYRPKGMEKGKGSLPYVHTLNGSGTAVGRALIAVMENYQQEDGSILVPDVLRPYMRGLKSIGGRS
jgi:seryl-tRNA synthetase